MTIETRLLNTIERYQRRLSEHGFSEKTLGWYKGKQDLRYNALIKHIPKNINSIVDVGCGFADGYEHLAGLIKNLKYVGIDLVPEFIEHCQERYPESTFYCSDYQKINLNYKYDALIASGIFNHNDIENYKLIEELLNYCAKNKIRYLAFDLLTYNVEYMNNDNFYFDVGTVIKEVNKFTRRFIIDHTDQPFEYTVFCDFEDAFNVGLSRYNVENER